MKAKNKEKMEQEMENNSSKDIVENTPRCKKSLASRIVMHLREISIRNKRQTVKMIRKRVSTQVMSWGLKTNSMA